jgi:hypothetical protein
MNKGKEFNKLNSELDIESKEEEEEDEDKEEKVSLHLAPFSPPKKSWSAAQDSPN